MRICPACGSQRVPVDWSCDTCNNRPTRLKGFVAFAPEAATDSDGFNASFHASLDKAQAGSFWFRARNRLIAKLQARYFPNAGKIFEVGCGTGYVLQALQQGAPQAVVSGSEIYVEALAFAAARLPAISALYQMDARAIPFADEFDVICAFDVLEHIEADERVLDEMWRSLVIGGGLLLAVPQHPSLWSRSDELACHKRRYKLGELEGKCRRSGFEILFSSSFVSSLLPLMALQRLTRARKQDFEFSSEMQLAPWLDQSLEMILNAEAWLVGRGFPLPFGGSRFVVAKKVALS